MRRPTPATCWKPTPGCRSRPATAPLYTQYHRPPTLARTLVLGLAAEPASARDRRGGGRGPAPGGADGRDHGRPGSPLAGEAYLVIEQQAGSEQGPTATKTYTSQLLILALLAAELSGDMSLDGGVARIPEAVGRALALDGAAAHLAGRLAAGGPCLTLAGGFNQATALELALLLREAGHLFAAPFAAADVAPGPAALAAPDTPVLVVGAYGPAESQVIGLARRLQENEACIFPITDDPALLALAEGPACALALTDALAGIAEPLSPLVSIVAGQLLALHVGLRRRPAPEPPRVGGDGGVDRITIRTNRGG